MAYAEIDSFVLKFKNLLFAGINADLKIKTEAGKTLITLAAEVKVPPTTEYHVHAGGGARERRRVRRAAARAAAAVGPVDSAVADSAKEATAIAAKASEDATKDLKAIEKVTAAEEAPTTVKIVEPIDEIENDTISSETKEELCQAISIIPLKKLDLSDEDIERILKQKLLAKNIQVLDCGVHRSSTGIFIRCDVAIEPVQRVAFEAINFEFGHCQAVPIYGHL